MNEKKLSAVKIGARVLSPEQAESLLPGYSRIADQINVFRNEAQKVREMKDFNADNTISILGGRGSGKTSVMMTFMHQHSEEPIYNNIDVVLPIIIPEDMSESNDTLGWFLGLLGEEVRIIENKLKVQSKHSRTYDDHFEKCLKREHSGLKERYDTLVRNYVLRKERFYELLQGRNVGKAEYIKQNEEYVHADQKLGIDFRKFIDTFTYYKKMINANDVEPLILVFFDDVDISAERCPEALETIRKYFSHPNIVVFVSGDYSVFSEAMTLEFLRREKIDSKMYPIVFMQLDRTSLLEGSLGEDSNALNQRKTRSQDYLKKVLPPSFRFEMKKIRDEDKVDFFYPVNNDSDNNVDLKGLLDGIEFKNGKTYKIPHPVYYRIFDDNPRGLINPFYFLYQKRESHNWLWDLKDLSRFLNVLVNSSLRLYDNRDVIEKTIQIGIRDKEITRIDYQYISDLYANFERQIRLNDQEKAIHISEETFYEDMITLYLLTDYFEKLCQTTLKFSDELEVLNKKEVLFRILNKPNVNKNMTIYPNSSDTVLLSMHEKISKQISFRNLQRLFERNNSLYFESKFYKAIAKIHGGHGTEIEQIRGINIFFKERYNEDEKWVQNHVDYIFEKGKSMQEVLDYNIDAYLKQLSFLGKEIIMPIQPLGSLYQAGKSLEDNIQQTLEKSILTNPKLIGNDFSEQQKMASKLIQSIEDEIESLEREIQRYELFLDIKSEYNEYLSALSVSEHNDKVVLEINEIQKHQENVERYANLVKAKKVEMEDGIMLPLEFFEVQKGAKDAIAAFDLSTLEKYEFYTSFESLIRPETRYLKWKGEPLSERDKNILIEYFNVYVELGYLHEYINLLKGMESDKRDNLHLLTSKQLNPLRRKFMKKLSALIRDTVLVQEEELLDNISCDDLKEYMNRLFGTLINNPNAIDYFGKIYFDLTNEFILIKLELDTKAKGNTTPYESMIQTLDNLIEQRKMLSGDLSRNIRLTDNQVEFLSHLQREFRLSAELRRLIADMLLKREFNVMDYQVNVDQLYRLFMREVEISSSNKRDRLKVFIRNIDEMGVEAEVVQVNPAITSLLEEVRKRSLTNCIKEYTQLTLQLKAWVQNRQIEENPESLYFRRVKEWFRSNTKSKNFFLSNFELYISKKLK